MFRDYLTFKVCPSRSFFGGGGDGWVEVVNQNIGNHASTVINQVCGVGGGGGGAERK